MNADREDMLLYLISEGYGISRQSLKFVLLSLPSKKSIPLPRIDENSLIGTLEGTKGSEYFALVLFSSDSLIEFFDERWFLEHEWQIAYQHVRSNSITTFNPNSQQFSILGSTPIFAIHRATRSVLRLNVRNSASSYSSWEIETGDRYEHYARVLQKINNES